MEETLVKAFKKMGARVKISTQRPAFERSDLTLNIKDDRKGEFFDIFTEEPNKLTVLDIVPNDRHLLLLFKVNEKEKIKFLCGHDERHWFSAQVKGSTKNVTDAKTSLQPANLKIKEKPKNKFKRKTKSFIRQGEWFFEPVPNFRVREFLIRKNELLSRGAGKPHIVEEAYRSGGTAVYTKGKSILSETEYNALTVPKKKGYRQMMEDAAVYCRGTVKHPDHKTIKLIGWHRVHMNNEVRMVNGALSRLRFLD